MTERSTKLRWIPRGGRYFADGVRGTYRALPEGSGRWRLGIRIGDTEWSDIGEFTSSAEAKRDAQERDSR